MKAGRTDLTEQSGIHFHISLSLSLFEEWLVINCTGSLQSKNC